MIFYFSSTGNSAWIAKLLGEKLKENIVSVNDLLRKEDLKTYEFQLNEKEHLIFVFPVHSWGIPFFMKLFLRRLEITGMTKRDAYAVCTCGDDAGYTNKMVASELKQKNIALKSCYTIQMPNTYILLPFFDVDSEKTVKEKIDNVGIKIDKILHSIIENKPDNSLYKRGLFAYFKTYLIYPGFIKHANGTPKFHTTEKCNKCGLCVSVCPAKNISIENGLVNWSYKCSQCLACIHKCPQKAIEYGNITQKKGRYTFRLEK